MSPVEVVHQLGTVALLRLLAGLLVFVVLHLVRLPLLLATRVLEVSMRRVDRFVVDGLTRELGSRTAVCP
jgi:hypothetical protein